MMKRNKTQMFMLGMPSLEEEEKFNSNIVQMLHLFRGIYHTFEVNLPCNIVHYNALRGAQDRP